MKTTVLSLGGSLIAPNEVDTTFLSSFRELITEHIKSGNRVIIVTGGGKTCRKYQDAASQITDVETVDLDWIGIAATKLNGHLVRSLFGKDSYEHVLNDPSKHVDTDRPVIIGSGFVPGSSSDKDAVILAKTFSADRVINLTNVDYVYDKNPNEYADAKPIERMTWTEFTKFFGTEWKPGLHSPFDPIAAVEAGKSDIDVLILNGSDLDNLKSALEGGDFKGTVLTNDS